MFYWAPYVFVRYAFFLSIGIVLYACFPDVPLSILTCVFGFCLVGYGILWYRNRVWEIFYPVWTGLLAAVLTALFGWLLTGNATESRQPHHIVHASASVTYYTAQVVSEVQTRAKNYRMVVAVQRLRKGKQWETTTGKILVYTSRQRAKPAYGDWLLIRGKPQKLQPPANPGEFDYQHFLSLQQIHLQHFVHSDGFRVYAHSCPNVCLAWSLRLRSWADSVLKHYVPHPHEQAIVSGLVLGIRDSMDNELKNAYAAAGAMHILAVSGAHVIVIFQIIAGCLGWLRKGSYGHLVFVVLALLLLWFYACVTGLSASVLRAVCMFSLVVVARAARREDFLFNTLGISAFGLLCYDPYLLQDVGFQLSYLAVAGIVYLQPRIYRWWNIHTRWLDWLWKSLSISLAAQLAVFPLAVFYFHQFPTYFLLANLCMIPVSVAILHGGLALLGVAGLPYVPGILAFGIHWATWLMNQMAFRTAQMPGAVVQGLHIGPWELVLAYGCLALILCFFYHPSVRCWAWIAAGLLVLAASQCYSYHRYHDQRLLAVYAIPGHATLDILDGRQHTFLADSALLANPSRILFHLRTHWGTRQVLDAHKIHFSQAAATPLAIRYNSTFSLLTWHGKRLGILHRPGAVPAFLYTHLDYLVVQNNSLTAPSLPDGWPGTVILDGSNRYYFSRHLANALQRRRIRCHNVHQQGAFLLSF